MSASDDGLKSKAYLVYSEFGPGLRTPRPRRLAAEFPQVSHITRENWLSEFKQVDSAVWKFAEEEAPSPTDTSGEVEHRFAQLFPWMTPEALQRTHFLASYFAWHEGYTKA
jgi:hypothetical protein